jgi:type IV pilus assembly protein PilA
MIQSKRRGFTIVELLVVILILAILMAIALPLYLGALSDSEKKTCRANMWSIAQAEQGYKTRLPAHTYTTNLASLFPDLGANTVCPVNGNYSVVISSGSDTANSGATVAAGGIIVKCDAAGHGVFAPGIDSQ